MDNNEYWFFRKMPLITGDILSKRNLRSNRIKKSWFERQDEKPAKWIILGFILSILLDLIF